MPHVQPGDLILVTGANGYLASLTITKLLAAGYRVRGTVRDVSAKKNTWMVPHYGESFSLVQVPDVAAPHAFDEVIKGVNGVAHVAASMIFLPDPNEVITPEINGMMNILEAAEKEESVKRVVYTSSQTACVQHEAGKKYHIDSSSWNEESKAAWTLPITPDFPRSYINYCAKKTEAEQRAYKWVEEKKPHFTFNSVVPNVNLGTVVRPDATGFISASGLLKMLWDGVTAFTDLLAPMWYVDVEDTALLHVAALTEADVQSERLFAFAGKYTYNEILAIFRKECPDRKFVDDIKEVEDGGTVDNKRSIEILKRSGKKEGFSALEEVIKKFIPLILKAEKEGWGTGDGNGDAASSEQLKSFD
ncbi:NAD dependent epimerase/dehydratase family protein [Massarina eburnea CBS 473.64]|uniref:NAD dependent epimerase/dehydratase family protein n=1 Tax=Massarina eburnea CBS 473.64 TaxID=1395130 RepID=A0A6A6SAE2_9PLEO|nr:NAD dependent epimerase/dehydratase family protein [Massarina eburnea CBS 473.64]